MPWPVLIPGKVFHDLVDPAICFVLRERRHDFEVGVFDGSIIIPEDDAFGPRTCNAFTVEHLADLGGETLGAELGSTLILGETLGAELGSTLVLGDTLGAALG